MNKKYSKKPEFVNKIFRMEKKLVKKLEEVAQRENVSVNAFVVQCCKYAFENMEARSE